MSGCTNYAGGGTIKSILGDTVAASRSGVYAADGTARWTTLVGSQGLPPACLRKRHKPTSFGHMLYTEALMAAVPRRQPADPRQRRRVEPVRHQPHRQPCPYRLRSSVRGTAQSSGGGLGAIHRSQRQSLHLLARWIDVDVHGDDPSGHTAVYLSALPQSGDTTLSASVGIPVWMASQTWDITPLRQSSPQTVSATRCPTPLGRLPCRSLGHPVLGWRHPGDGIGNTTSQSVGAGTAENATWYTITGDASAGASGSGKHAVAGR